MDIGTAGGDIWNLVSQDISIARLLGIGLVGRRAVPKDAEPCRLASNASNVSDVSSVSNVSNVSR